MLLSHKIYIAIISLVFLGITVVFDFLPRSAYSPLEKRDLARFPQFSWEKLASGEFTKQVNSWFSDTEPYRDELLAMSMQEKGWLSMTLSDDDAITFHASDDAMDEDDEAMEADERNVKKAAGLDLEGSATIANKGIIVVGKGDKTRALMAYGGGKRSGGAYARIANRYKEMFPDVNVYCMVIPTAIDFYCPAKVKSATNEELPTINNIYSMLNPDVHAVNIYTPLGEHAKEDIFLRTDHHWAPLGAYYAAQKFAQVAKVPFRDLKSYERRVVHRFSGSMYAYSHDIELKNNPEDFVYYVPKGIKYTTTYIDYIINEEYQVTSEGKPRKGQFFMRYHDGNGGAYCTFMGGDTHIVKVQTGTHNGRRVMILKDSFGNALPGYMFFSFEEVHVVDMRYFTKNMVDYVRQNRITDILFANNIFNTCNKNIYHWYDRYLTQANGAGIHPGGASKHTIQKSTDEVPTVGETQKKADSLTVSASHE